MLFPKTWTTLAMLAGASAAPASPEIFDYIIVGGGTAGSALATRLSLGLPWANIILLEAGPSALDDVRINIPGLRGSLLGTELDWQFATVPQAGLGGRSFAVNRGKVLGGSSAMNYLCYDRAAAAEYDAWGELGNCGESWSWKTMIAAMTKSENFTGTDNDIHGRSGPISSTYNRVLFDAIKAWVPAIKKLGINDNTGKSLNGKPIGAGLQPTNIDVTRYTRSYSANGYLPRAKKNLVVRTGVEVVRVVLKDLGGGLTATGVELADGSIIHCDMEVVLSAGSVQSPGLLERSGVGARAILKAAGITTKINLPGVGENLQDHVRASNTYQVKAGVETFDPYIFDSTSANATGEFNKWLAGKVSILDYTTAAYGFLNWAQVSTKVQENLIKLAKAAVSSTSSIDKKKLAFLSDPSVPDLELIYEANFVGAGPYTGGGFLTLISTVMHPLARGSIHINPQNPRGKPVIDPKFFNNEHDIAALVEGIKYARKIANTEPIKSLWTTETEPGAAAQTDAQIRDFAIKTGNSFYHLVGTNSMLPREDGGVVDEDLVVYGTTNLRVVDNSIIPIIISAHIQTAAYAIAEIGAAKIIAAV